MGSGAFRDTSAALERVRILEDEVEALKAENASLRERADALLAGLDKDKLGAELRKALQERDTLRREGEDQHAANVAIVKRLKDERKALEQQYESKLTELERQHDAKVAALEARLDPAMQALEHAYAGRDPATNAHRLVEVMKERDALAIRLATGMETEGTNVSAVLKRAIDERDELVREVQHLREAHAMKPARSFIGRLFR